MSRWLCTLLGFAIAACFACTAQTQEPAQRVLLLYQESISVTSIQIISAAVQKRLIEKSSRKVEVYSEFLDQSRFPGPEHEQRMARYLAEKYAATPPEVVIAVSSVALRLIVEHQATIAPGAAIIYCAISRYTLGEQGVPESIPGIVLEVDLAKTLTIAARLQPAARKVVVVAGASTFDRRWEQIARQQLAPFASRYETRFLIGLPRDQLLDELRQLAPDTIVLLTSMLTDGTGRSRVVSENTRVVTEASSAPVYGLYPTQFGHGIVGGFLDSFEAHGTAVADLAIRILAGDATTIRGPQSNTASFMVDWRALQRWRLADTNVPAEAVVRFKEPSLWEQHRDVVLWVVVAFALQSCIVVVLLVQVRQRRRAEVSLARSEERMAYAAASVNVGLWQYDRASGELWATDHCRAMFGIPATQPLTSEAFLQSFHPDDHGGARQWMRSAAEGRFPSISEFRVVLKNGRIAWYLARVHARYDDDGKLAGISGTFSDITARKVAETEAESQRHMLAHVTRVSSLGELSGAIAHEINQPLTAIMANAQAAQRFLDKDPPDLAEVRAVLEDIIQEDGRADQVIRRLRGMLKKGESKAEPVVVNDLLRPVLELLRGEIASRRIKVELDLADDLPKVLGDPVQLQQILMNLVMNAMDAVCLPQASQRTILIGTRSPTAGHVEVTVTDRGPGLAAGQEALAFEPFYTTKEHGLGLGLSICASIASSHGGILRLANDDQSGARASLTLPAMNRAATMPALS